LVQVVGDDEPEHRVAEELEALVVREAAVLVREGAVGQGTSEQQLVDGLPGDLGEVSGELLDGPLLRCAPVAHCDRGLRPGARYGPRSRSSDPCRCRSSGRPGGPVPAPCTGGRSTAQPTSPSSWRGGYGCSSATSSASGRPRQFLFSSLSSCP